MEIADFLRECIENAGGLADTSPAGVMEALLPAELQRTFADQEMARLALTPDAASQFHDAIPVLPGSHGLDAFVQYALGHGRLSHVFAPMELRPRSIAGDIVHTLKFTVGRVRLPEEPASVEPASIAQFDFIISVASDEMEQSLRSVVVDLWTGRPCPILSQSAARLEVAPTGLKAGGRNVCSLPKAYETACAALSGWMAPQIARRQALVGRRLQDESARLRLYYAGMAEDLERRIQRHGESAERASGLRQKLQATHEELAAKLGELAEKHRLRPSARLAAVRTITYPRLFAAAILDRKQSSRKLDLCWDPLLGRLRLPACEACGAETAHIEMTRDDRLLCPSCAAAR